MTEIERRFLVRVGPAPPGTADQRQELRQASIAVGERSVRIRRREGDFVLSVKSGRGLIREEIEVPVNAGNGEALLRIAGERFVEKTRYVIGRWEVDLYHGKLEGLAVAECELRADDEPLPEPPRGLTLVREVTRGGGFTAQRLARPAPERARRLVRRVRRVVERAE